MYINMHIFHTFTYICTMLHKICLKYVKIPIFTYTPILSLLCPTFCSILLEIRPGKYLPCRISNINA